MFWGVYMVIGEFKGETLIKGMVLIIALTIMPGLWAIVEHLFCDEWLSRGDKNYWIADATVGSLKDSFYHSKKHNRNKPQLRGRLINIKSLTINGKTVFGEQNSHPTKKLVFVAQGYVNELDIASAKGKGFFYGRLSDFAQLLQNPSRFCRYCQVQHA